MPHIFSDRSW